MVIHYIMQNPKTRHWIEFKGENSEECRNVIKIFKENGYKPTSKAKLLKEGLIQTLN